MFILDTNVVSEMRRLDKANPQVVAWASSTPLSQMFIATVTVMELELGILLMERKDRDQGLILRTWFDRQVRPRFEGRVFDYTMPVALCCASLHVPDPLNDRDAIIAATAIVHGMTVVTRNTKDFRRTGAALLNPWR